MVPVTQPGWIRHLTGLWTGLLDAALPQTCPACNEWIASDADAFCGDCSAALAAIRAAHYCRRCGRSAMPASVDDAGCGFCRGEDWWRFAGVARVATYEPPIATLLKRLKYAGDQRCAAPLGRMLAEVIKAEPWAAEIDALVPVPMHWLRRTQRPCDHARLLADELARRLGKPVLHNAIVRRIKNTPSQTTRSRTARFENVRGCFAVRRPARLAGKRVCIVDNLMATGATASELRKVLRAAGAAKICVAVLARSTLPGDRQARPLVDTATP